MNELYEAIEAKIKASGYPREISGEAVYNDICDQIEGKENGDYVVLSKFEEDVVFEYHITISDEALIWVSSPCAPRKVYLKPTSMSNCRSAFHTVWPKTRRYFFAHLRTF